MTAPVTTAFYRVDANPFNSELDVQTAIMEYAVSNPDDVYSIRQYTDGYYVLVLLASGGQVWLTVGNQK